MLGLRRKGFEHRAAVGGAIELVSKVADQARLAPHKRVDSPTVLRFKGAGNGFTDFWPEDPERRFVLLRRADKRAEQKGKARLAAPVGARPRKGALTARRQVHGHRVEHSARRPLGDVARER